MTNTNVPGFDMEAAIQAFLEDQDLTGKNGILTPLIKQLTKVVMQGELKQHLAEGDSPDRKNGST